MKKWLSAIAIARAGAAAVLIVQRFQAPTTLAECQAKAAQSARTDEATAFGLIACEEKFASPSTDADRIRLTPGELALLTGRAGPSFGNLFAGTVYNGNRDVRVTELEVDIKSKGNPFAEYKTYRASVGLDPLSPTTFSFTFPSDGSERQYDWQIKAAYGVRMTR